MSVLVRTKVIAVFCALVSIGGTVWLVRRSQSLLTCADCGSSFTSLVVLVGLVTLACWAGATCIGLDEQRDEPQLNSVGPGLKIRFLRRLFIWASVWVAAFALGSVWTLLMLFSTEGQLYGGYIMIGMLAGGTNAVLWLTLIEVND